MKYEIKIRYPCENPEIICNSIKQDDIENTTCNLKYTIEETYLSVVISSTDIKNLQKSFNSFSQRFKLAEDAYNFCKE
ncbi:hypothetical protein AAJ76_800076036 [Vairimorpha ceranae]|uniref:Transcription factor pcc1 n=1 Tax=Vairimorpha ceranae TaxID=40302 RepID=A0A0F9WF99_9MICR|nr:hypothetical protein AAJ76_800076036 [Vairimorpha ceranae]KKO76016.1 hypothetical protein AAJ76_800076036 [Vairimorpha ceranae]